MKLRCALSILILLLAPPGLSAAKKGRRSMVIKLARSTCSLTAAIPLTVTITNSGSRRVVRDKPQTSMEVSVHVVDRATHQDLTYTMGRITTTVIDKASGQFATVLPPPEEVTLEPGEKLEFSTDLNERLFLYRGHFDVVVRDHGAESNRLPLAMEVTRESVDVLFDLARNAAADYSRREWATGLLRRLQPDFRLKLATPDDPPATAAANEAANQSLYDRFAAWWKDNRDKPETPKLLQSM